MSLVLDILSWAALLAGGFFALVSAIGLQRMPDLFTRIHATSVNDTLGVGFLVLGMLLQMDDWAVAARLVILLILLYTAGAVTAHALVRAALYDGNFPLLSGSDGKLRPTDCATIDPELAEKLARPLSSQRIDDSEIDRPTLRPRAIKPEGDI